MEYKNIKLSQNRMEVNVPAVSASVTARNSLRYYLDIFVPKSFQSQEYEALIRLEASEVPPYDNLGMTIYEGAYFPIDSLMSSLLQLEAPIFGQASFLLCEGLTTPFYLVTTRMNGTTILDTATLPTEYVLRAGIAENDFPTWKNAVFQDSSGLAGKFLTWCKNPKPIDRGQPEYLYYLTNSNPSPTSLKLRLRKHYADGTDTTSTAIQLDGIVPQAVYCVPVGIKPLGIDTDPKEISMYDVWIENETGMSISETRTYNIDVRYRRNTKYILFSNSLGGFDTLRALGQSQEELKVSRQSANRYYPFGSSANFAERITNQVTGERELTIRTGWLSKAEVSYFQELILAKEIYLVGERDFLPLSLLTESYINNQDDENLSGREFVFSYTNKVFNYSRLPAPPVAIARTKAWRVFGTPTMCYLNDHNIRTGQALYPLLEQYYTDDNTAVVPQTIKKNTAGTAGYILAAPAASCATTPYYNSRISRASTYRYAGSTCLNPYIGNFPTLVVEAGTWGSETSQAQADALAEADWATLNTQAYANANGACVLMRYVNVEIRRNGTFQRNNCAVGYAGTTAEIVVAAGLFGSETSQADANAQAEARWQTLNTQAYANANGACVVLPSGLSASYHQYPNSGIPFNQPGAGPPANVFSLPAVYRIDSTIDQYPSFTLPSGINNDKDCFAVRWTGKVKAPATATITFNILHDDGVRLWVNGVLIIDQWIITGNGNSLGSIDLELGKYYDIVVEYFEYWGGEFCQLKWAYGTQANVVVPAQNLFH